MYMYLDLKKDIGTLLVETKVFQEDLEMTRRDCINLVKEHKINEWTDVIEHFKKLESALIIMQVDCVTLMGQTYQSQGTWQVFNRFYLTFYSLDSLLNELKHIRNRFVCSLNYPSQLKHSDIDWERSRETINQIRKYLLAGLDFYDTDQYSLINRGYKRFMTIGGTL